MHREMGQQHMMDGWAIAPQGNKRLEAIDAAIDWAPIAKAVQEIHSAKRGRGSYPPLLMVKALLLAQWYQLSDPGLEEALADRLSFRRFVGLSLAEAPPDETTICRFRGALGRKGRARRVFEEINGQLDALGMVLRQGTLLDATLVKAQPRPPGPCAPKRAEGRRPDPDATYTRRGHQVFYGYKAHLAVDQDSGLVRAAQLTPANINESQVADELIQGDERAVYADKGYENKHRRTRLRARRAKDRIMHRSHKNQRALPRWQQRRNALIAPVRRKVERVFGTLKRSYGYARMRYYNLERNAAQLYLICVAMNLRRMLTLADSRA